MSTTQAIFCLGLTAGMLLDQLLCWFIRWTQRMEAKYAAKSNEQLHDASELLDD